MPETSPQDHPQHYMTGRAAREAARAGVWRRPTAGMAPGFVQANLVVLPYAQAFDFLRFCFYNPKSCPLLDVTGPGDFAPDAQWARDADIRTDVPGYRVYRQGVLAEEPRDLNGLWQPDFVSLLIGCSFTFEQALLEASVPVRHIECGCNVPMYETNIRCKPAGIFAGPMVVSMRPVPAALVQTAVAVTGRFPSVHGEPVQVGDPATLGITDIHRPDFGDPVPLYPGEVPVFWACGVTPQAVALAAKVPLMITHAPGHMFVTDRRNVDLMEG